MCESYLTFPNICIMTRTYSSRNSDITIIQGVRVKRPNFSNGTWNILSKHSESYPERRRCFLSASWGFILWVRNINPRKLAVKTVSSKLKCYVFVCIRLRFLIHEIAQYFYYLTQITEFYIFQLYVYFTQFIRDVNCFPCSDIMQVISLLLK